MPSVVAAALAALSLAGCGGASPPAASSSPVQAVAGAANPKLQQLVDGAKKESVLKGMWSTNSFGGAQGWEELVAGLNKRYGLSLKPQFTPGPNMQAFMGQIIQEAAANKPASTDVMLGNAQTTHAAEGTNALKPQDWASIVDRPVQATPDFDPVAPGGISLAISSTVTGVTYNPDLVKDPPRKLSDLLDPKWKGKIASTAAANGFPELATKGMLGHDYMLDFMKKFTAQIGGLERCGEWERQTSGEFLMLAMDCGANDTVLAQRKGAPINEALLDEGTIVHTFYAGVPATSSAPNSAALMIAYMQSPEGQALLWKHGGMDLSLVPESHSKQVIDQVKAKGGKVATDSPQWLDAATDYSATQKEFQALIQKSAK